MSWFLAALDFATPHWVEPEDVFARATRHVGFTMDYDTNRFRILRLPNLMLVHWLVNPGVAFNELILGQRIPRTMLVEKRIEEGAVRRSFASCGECGRIHDSMLWGGRNAFGHWLGYFCPDCGAKIPCLWNLASLVILAVTFPVWILPVVIFRDRWIRFERARLQRRRDRMPVMQGPEVFVQMGVFSGVLMGLAMVLLDVVESGGIRSASHLATVGLGGAMFCGPLFGVSMWLILGRSDKSARVRGSKVGSGR